MAAWLAFVVAAVVVSLVFFHDLFSKYDKKTKASALIFMSALASIVAASVVISPGKDRAPNHYYWGQEAFLAASKIALPGHCYEYLRPTVDKDAKLFKRHDTRGDCGAAAFLEHYVGMTKVGNLLAVVGSFSAVFGMVLHLSRPVRFVPGEAEARDRDLKKYLYLSAILLSLGTAIYTTAGQIPIGVLAEDASSIYRHFGQSFAIFWGTAFSAIIASTYFMVLFLRQDADAIDEKSAEGASPSKMSAEFRDIVSTLVAILSPILTGLIGTNVTLGL